MFSVDPFPEVAQSAGIVVDYIHLALLDSPLGSATQEIIDEISRASLRTFSLTLPTANVQDNSNKPPDSPGLDKRESYFLGSLRRSASIAASLKNLALGYANGDSASNSGSAPSTPKGSKSSVGERSPEWNRPPDANDPLSSGSTYHSARQPTPRNFQSRDIGEKPTIPLQSQFMEWSIEVRIISRTN